MSQNSSAKKPHTNKPFPKWLRITIPIASIVIIALGTYLAVKIAKGYRPTKNGLQGTGLLAANSFPNGAEVYINGKLTTATDQTLNLPPADYDITIKKDGFIPWEKHVKLEAEIVTQTNATLFPAVPSLSPLTLSGATNITPSPDGTKVAYAVASASAEAKNGLYIMDLTTSPLPFQRSPKLVAKSMANLDFSKAVLLWSPSSTQILAHFTTGGSSNNYLLDTDKTYTLDSIGDVTARLPVIFSDWEEEIATRETKQFALLPGELQHIATASAKNVYFSPNEERVMYTSTEYAQLPQNLIPPLVGTSTQPEERSLEPHGIYIYDLKEDKNFRVGSEPLSPAELPAAPTKSLLLLSAYQQSNINAATISATRNSSVPALYTKLQNPRSIISTIYNFKTHYSPVYVNHLQWFPDSAHILTTDNRSINVLEYDNTNHTTLYAGPFADNFVYPWPDGSKLIILTNLNAAADVPTNLYTISLK